MILPRTYRSRGHYIGDPQVYRRRRRCEAPDAGPDRQAARSSRSRTTRGATSTRGVAARRGSVEFAGERRRPSPAIAEERLRRCPSPRPRGRAATRELSAAMRATRTSSSWARTSPRWAARWASRRGCSRSSAASASGTHADLGDGDRRRGHRRRDAGHAPDRRDHVQDFTTLAMDQVVNQAAKHRYMSGGQVKVPLTVRTQGGAGWSPGAQHAQQLEAVRPRSRG